MAFGLTDLIKVGSLLLGHRESNKQTSADDKFNDAWNRYDRQVDLLALDKLIDQQRRQRALLLDRQALEGERQQRLYEGAVIDESRSERLGAAAGLERLYGLAEADAAWDAAKRERDELMDRLGVEVKQLDYKESQLQQADSALWGDLNRLETLYGYKPVQIAKLRDEFMVGAGLMTPREAARRENARRVKPQVAGDGRTMAQRLGLLGVMDRQIRIERAVGTGRLAEQAAMAKGSLGSQQAARGVSGSWAITERARIGREHSRQRAELESQSDVAEAELRERKARADIEVGALAGRARGIGAQYGVLGAERTKATGTRGRIGEAVADAEEAARRERGRAEIRYAAGIEDAEKAALGAREQRTEAKSRALAAKEAASQHRDLMLAGKIAEWQKKTIPTLPTSGGSRSRSSVGLMLQIGAVLAD